MSERTPPKPYNLVVRAGIWISVAAGVFWAGGYAYNQVKEFVPWILGGGIATLIIGLALQFRKPSEPAK